MDQHIGQILLDDWTRGTVHDVTRYAIFAFGVWFVLWVVLKPLLIGRKIRSSTPEPKQMVSEFFHSLRSVAIFSTVGLIATGLDLLGLMKGHEIAMSWGPGWFWVSLVLMLIGHDAWFYWVHKTIHHRKLFRTLHRRHHLSHNPSPFTAYSFDIGEAALQALFVPLWMFIVPTPWQIGGLFVLIQIIKNTIGHSGYELYPSTKDGKPLFDWMTTVTHHDLHHAQAGYNFGLYFTFWDRLMGTEHPDYHAHFARSVRKQGAAAQADAIPAE